MLEAPSHLQKNEIGVAINRYPDSFNDLTPSVRKKMQVRWDEATAHKKADLAFDNKISPKTQEEFENIAKLMRPEQPEVKEIDLGNMVARLIYEVHGQGHSPMVVRELDSYASEMMLLLDDVEKIKANPNGAPVKIESESEDLSHAALKDQGKAIMLIDVFASPELMGLIHKELQDEKVAMAGTGVVFAGSALASSYYLLKSLASKVEENKQMSRRRFLQTLGISAAAATGLVGLGGIPQMTRSQLSEGSVSRKLERGSTQAAEMLGFSEISLLYRNAVMAQKLHGIAERSKGKKVQATDGKPRVGLRIGAAHSGIENMLKMPESERLNFIAKITHSLKERGIGVDPAGIVRIQYDRKGGASLIYEIDKKIQNAVSAEK